MQRHHWKFASLFFVLLLAVPQAHGDKRTERNSWRPRTIEIPKYSIHDRVPNTTTFSPDGRTLAVVRNVGSYTSDVLLCDVATRKVMARIKNARSPLFLGKGDRIAVTFTDHSRPVEGDWRAKICSVPDARLLALCPPSFFPISESKNGRTLIGIKHFLKRGYCGDLFRWDLGSKALPNLWHSLPKLPVGESRRNCWLTADNSTLVDLTATYSNGETFYQTLYFRNIATGKLRSRVRKREANYSFFSLGAKGSFALHDDGLMEIWNCKTGKLRSSFPAKFFIHTSESVLSPDGTVLALFGSGDDIRLWHTSSGKLLRTIKHDKGGASFVAFSADGRTLASSGGYDHIVKLWRIK